MMQNFDSEFLNAYKSLKGYLIPPEGLIELSKYFPERYGKVPVNLLTDEAGAEYLSIIRSYLRFYRIPITMESITASYDWGFGNMRKNGLYQAPIKVKQLMAEMRHLLQPQAEQLDNIVD
jgi:hypothetical protein